MFTSCEYADNTICVEVGISLVRTCAVQGVGLDAHDK